MIGNLVSGIIANTDPADLLGCVAFEGERIDGCIFFSRFIVPSGQLSYLLSPVAVRTDQQQAGTGQQLINYGLEQLKALGASLVFTYGDPAYYCKTGFKKINENVVQAPFTLSQPVGWQVQALDGQPVRAMRGATQCISALADPKYW